MWLIWLITISFLLLIPGNSIPQAGFIVPHLDKLVHLAMFAILSFLTLSNLRSKRKFTGLKEIVMVVLFSSGIGLVLELVQELFIKGRYFDWWDVVANTIGAIIGVSLLFKKNK